MAEITTTVKQVLERKSTGLFTVASDTRIFEALTLMAQHDVGAVLVTNPQGHLLGIFTERDYSRKVVLKGLSSKDAQVGELMTSSVVTIASSARINEVMRIMTERKFRHLPVVDAQQLIGIITIGDVVKAVIDDQEATIKQLASYIAGDLTS